MFTRPQLIQPGTTAVVSSLLTLFVKNFISGEKKIKQRIPRRHGIAGGQFERSMSQLLGPPILDGNRIRRLENGVEIFPAMLAGIARAKGTICFETYIKSVERHRALPRWLSLQSGYTPWRELSTTRRF